MNILGRAVLYAVGRTGRSDQMSAVAKETIASRKINFERRSSRLAGAGAEPSFRHRAVGHRNPSAMSRQEATEVSPSQTLVITVSDTGGLPKTRGASRLPATFVAALVLTDKPSS